MEKVTLLHVLEEPYSSGTELVPGAEALLTLRRIIHGNEAEMILHSTPCLVLVVKEPGRVLKATVRTMVDVLMLHREAIKRCQRKFTDYP